MAEQKTKPTNASVAKFIKDIPDEIKRKDCETLLAIMRAETKVEPKMWGPSMIGFGSYHYKYASGHEGDCFIAGFSPRKDALTLHLMGGLHGHAELLKVLGKHKTGKGCLYIKKLEDVHLPTLKKMIKAGIKSLEKQRTE